MQKQKISKCQTMKWNEIFHSHSIFHVDVDEAMNAAHLKREKNTKREIVLWSLLVCMALIQSLNNVKRNATRTLWKRTNLLKKKKMFTLITFSFVCMSREKSNNHFFFTTTIATLAFDTLACALHLASILDCVYARLQTMFKGKWNYEQIFSGKNWYRYGQFFKYFEFYLK